MVVCLLISTGTGDAGDSLQAPAEAQGGEVPPVCPSSLAADGPSQFCAHPDAVSRFQFFSKNDFHI